MSGVYYQMPLSQVYQESYIQTHNLTVIDWSCRICLYFWDTAPV